jgi:predicted metalloprotease with PDZ domain
MLTLPLAQAAGTDLLPASNSTELLLSNSSQGYLGVVIRDLDNERATSLKLKDPHGAEIVSIDQDAPASKAGLKVHDVVVQMNGQRIEGIEQFRRMLRETPPGRNVALVVMRDGQTVNLTAQLGDHAAIVTQIFGGLDTDPPAPSGGDGSSPAIVLPRSSRSGSFFGSLTRSRYYVGVDIQPLPTGLADYFGAKNGVLVGNVFSNSPAAAAGLKPADVIQKVNGQPIATLSDWERAMRVNHGKQVQVTIIRDRKEQTLNMVAGVTRTSSELDLPDFDLPDAQAMAEQLRSEVAGIDSAALADQIKRSMQGIDAEALRHQAEEAARSFDSQKLEKMLEQNKQQWQDEQKQIQRQMEELKRQLQSLHVEQMD